MIICLCFRNVEHVGLKMHARGQCTSFGCKFEKRKRKLKENMPSTSDVAHMKDLLEKKVYLLPSLDFTSSVTLFHFVFVFSWF